jgi:tryptophan-rich sensory protein
MRAALLALLICVAAAAAEGLLAGRGTRERLTALRQPRLSPPFAVWMGIAAGYYAICFALLFRLFRSEWQGGAAFTSLLLLLLLMSLNALWNLYFFRRRDLRASFVVTALYGPVAVALTVALSRLGDRTVWIFVPYLLYLVYGGYYAHATWRQNTE